MLSTAIANTNTIFSLENCAIYSLSSRYIGLNMRKTVDPSADGKFTLGHFLYRVTICVLVGASIIGVCVISKFVLGDFAVFCLCILTGRRGFDHVPATGAQK